jgi:hypothetical protein
MPTSRGNLRPGAAISQQDAVHGAAARQQPARVVTFRPRARSGSRDASRSVTSLRSAGDRVVIRLDERLRQDSRRRRSFQRADGSSWPWVWPRSSHSSGSSSLVDGHGRVASRRRFVTFAVPSASNAPRTPRTPCVDVVFLFVALRCATARPLRTLGVVQRMPQRSSASLLGHVLPRVLGRPDPVAPPIDGQTRGCVGSRSPASWSDRCALRATGGVV